MEQAALAITAPGSNLWGQTFMKKHSGKILAGTGEYIYTDELKKFQSQSTDQLEYFGYFHVANMHSESENRLVWGKTHIRNSLFGREVLTCFHSNNFNPWSVMERIPHKNGSMDIYLIYACGPEFMLVGANLKLEIALYGENEQRATVESRF